MKIQFFVPPLCVLVMLSTRNAYNIHKLAYVKCYIYIYSHMYINKRVTYVMFGL